MQKTAAIYARFSSDLQEDRSIEDQIEVCRVLAKRESLKIVTTFNDRAKSGSTLFDRGGLRDLETAAKERRFNVLIVESLDRLSRDQADLAYLFKRLEFAEIKILTSEGYATSMHVGIRGLVGSMFLKDLGDKVRRGLGGRARDGKVPGSVCYGYRRVPGRPGEREIVPEEVAVVQRIFTQYAAGRSPRAIAFDLSREGIPSPSGAKNWSHQVFTGSTLRHGMLGNRIYIGEIEWNKTRTVRNPQTGRRTKRAAPNDELIIASAPHLRIIDQALWAAAARVRQNRAIHQFGGDGTLGPREHSGRNEYLLAGLLRCGVCASHMRIAVKPRGESARVACAAAHQFGTCEHRRTYDLDKLQSGIFENMRSKLTDPKLIAEKAKAYHARYAEREKQNRSDAGSIRKRLDRVETQINRLGTAISESDESVPVLMARLRPLEAERVGLVEKLRLIKADANVVTLHPKALDIYCQNVERLHTELISSPDVPASAREAFRNLIDSVVVHPTAKRMDYEFTPYGRLSVILGADLFPTEQGVSSTSITAIPPPREPHRTSAAPRSPDAA